MLLTYALVPCASISGGKMIVVIDNYDSFVYNLVQYIGEYTAGIKVFRNDKISIAGIKELNPSHLVISPGPCTPSEAGISVEAVRFFAGKLPILGVCLGHQSIVAAFGGKIIRSKKLMHGKTSFIHHDGKTIYNGLKNPFEATRYHSLIADKKTLPKCFEISSWVADGTIMGVRLKFLPHSKRKPKNIVEGVQFHPESILTSEGKKLIRNFILGTDK